MTSTEAILEEVLAERLRQQLEEDWTLDHDDLHSVSEWVALVVEYEGYAMHAARLEDQVLYRKRLIQVAAIIVAAAESFDRAMQSMSMTSYFDR